MRKLTLILFALALTIPGWARMESLYVGTGAETPDIYDQTAGDAFFAAEVETDGAARFDGAVTLGDAAADVITVTGTMAIAQTASFPDGTELLPSIANTGDPDSGYWWSAADVLNASCGGVEQLELDATSLDIVPDTNIAGALDITGDTDLDIVDVDGALTLPDGLVTAPSWQIESDLQSGPYLGGPDQIAWAIAGVLIGTMDADGLNTFDIGQTTPGEIDATTGSFTGDVDLAAGLVGQPTLAVTGSLTSGVYQSAVDEWAYTITGAQVGRWDGTGLIAVGFNGPIGTTVPAQGEFTNIYGSDDFYYGQEPGDLHEGYRRSEFIKCVCTFDHGSDIHYAVQWDLTNVVGAGTNEITSVDGWATLTTGGAGGPDSEETISNGLNHYRAYTPRVECSVDFTGVSGTFFAFGFYAAANEYCEIRYNTAVGANWLLVVDDTGGATTVDSGIAVTVDPTKLELWVDATGTPGWAIDDADVAPGATDDMTANAHYLRLNLTDIAAAPHVVSADYIVIEQLKMQ